MQGVHKLDRFPHCVHAAAAAAIEEQPVRRLHWTKLFSQKECLTVFPNYCCPERLFGLNRISHSDWVKLSVELNYAPNKNTKFLLLQNICSAFKLKSRLLGKKSKKQNILKKDYVIKWNLSLKKATSFHGLRNF